RTAAARASTPSPSATDGSPHGPDCVVRPITDWTTGRDGAPPHPSLFIPSPTCYPSADGRPGPPSTRQRRSRDPAMTEPTQIRNFSIIAHIDHAKSTLCDQFLLTPGAISEHDFRNEGPDSMGPQRERGIPNRMHPGTLYYEHQGKRHELNLVDTPGLVDFSYEVSRSLAAWEGAILLVDSTQGVQAQTVANAYAAINADLAIVPALNKIDMQAARPDEIKEEIENTLGIDRSEVLAV